jgi:hypothetical protein
MSFHTGNFPEKTAAVRTQKIYSSPGKKSIPQFSFFPFFLCADWARLRLLIPLLVRLRGTSNLRDKTCFYFLYRFVYVRETQGEPEPEGRACSALAAHANAALLALDDGFADV